VSSADLALISQGTFPLERVASLGSISDTDYLFPFSLRSRCTAMLAGLRTWMTALGHKEPYSTASPHDRCTVNCGSAHAGPGGWPMEAHKHRAGTIEGLSR
jgi:hypothetical protein